jgi:hypothetical protein
VGLTGQVLDDSRYGPTPGNRNWQLVDVQPHRGAGAAIAAGQLLAFNDRVRRLTASGTLDGMIQANADTCRQLRRPVSGMSTCSVCTLICRVKALKRQMFGRANLDLLRKGILLSA